MVKSPELRRPPVRCLTASSGLWGRFVVMSSLTSVVVKRRVGVIGLYVLIGIFLAHLQRVNVVGHFLARLETNVGFLPVGAKAGELTAAALLAQEIGRTHAVHFHLEQCFDCLLDFGLGRAGSHIEYQRALGFFCAQTFFGNEGTLDHVIKSRHQATSARLRLDTVFFNDSCNCSMAAREKSARS